jgi:hypothetical protein
MTKGIDYLKSGSPQFKARQRRHRHNGYLGQAKMATLFCGQIIRSDSTTAAAKGLATEAYRILSQLEYALKTRVDPPS